MHVNFTRETQFSCSLSFRATAEHCIFVSISVFVFRTLLRIFFASIVRKCKTSHEKTLNVAAAVSKETNVIYLGSRILIGIGAGEQKYKINDGF